MQKNLPEGVVNKIIEIISNELKLKEKEAGEEKKRNSEIKKK